MSHKIGRITYYGTAEVCRMAGISKNTLLRWVKQGVLPDASSMDRHGWRLFTMDDVERFKVEANRVEKFNQPESVGLDIKGGTI